MILVTVGTQLAFDRMVGVVDEWATESGADVLAQVGPSSRQFGHIRQVPFLEPDEFDRCFTDASLVVAHAGMGSILRALSYGKPIIVMPRRADLGEHRNDHQMATARRFAHYPAVRIAWDESELAACLRQLAGQEQRCGDSPISAYAPDEFIARLRGLIEAD